MAGEEDAGAALLGPQPTPSGVRKALKAVLQAFPDHPGIAEKVAEVETGLQTCADLCDMLGRQGGRAGDREFNEASVIGRPLGELGEQVQEAGQLNLALRVLRLAAHYDGRTWSRPMGVQSNDPPRTVIAGTTRLVGVLCKAGQLDEAEQLATRALRLYSREGEREDPNFAHLLVAAGDVASDRCQVEASDSEKAEGRYRRALRIREAKLGPDDVETAVSLGRVARFLLYRYVEKFPKLGFHWILGCFLL
jgi:tetratricopeptide (TPR) repeat protein